MSSFSPQAVRTLSRIDSVDVLRGFMALAVAAYHLALHTKLFAAGTWENNAVTVGGLYGVQGFFIVSGFCFFHLYEGVSFGSRELKRFHIKRFFRIAPLYYVAMTCNILFRQAERADDFGQRVFENITMTFGLVQPSRGQMVGGWSIGVEYVFYMLLPLLVALTRKKYRLYLLAAAFAALAVPWTFRFVPETAHFDNQKFVTYVDLANHAFLFFFGGIIAHLRSLTPKRLGTAPFAIAVLLIAAVSEITATRFYDHFDCVIGLERVRHVTLCALLVAAFAFYDVPKHAARRPFIFLGDISYSVYLTHPFALMIAQIALPRAHPVAVFFSGIAMTLLVSTATHRLLEKPMMALGRRLSERVR